MQRVTVEHNFHGRVKSYDPVTLGDVENKRLWQLIRAADIPNRKSLARSGIPGEVSFTFELHDKGKEHEFGDLLFTLVNVARWLELDPESALRETNLRFYKRFTSMEAACRKRGVNLADLSFEEQNELWEDAKRSVADK